MNLTIQLIGWTGTLAYIAAYICVSLRILKPDTHFYHILNVVGGVCLVINAFSLTDMPAIVVNIAWIVIAFASMIRNRFFKKHHAS